MKNTPNVMSRRWSWGDSPRISLAWGTALCAVLVSSACAMQETTTPPSSSATPLADVTPTSAPSERAEASVSYSSGEHAPLQEGCSAWQFSKPGDTEGIIGRRLQIPVDLGPREHADGEVKTGADDVPVAYIVAQGDQVQAIADRLCVKLTYLATLNSARRDGFTDPFLYAGDTINLDAHTILSVGDQGGEVRDNNPGGPLPPQR